MFAKTLKGAFCGIWGALVLCAILIGAGVYLPPLARVLGLSDPGPVGRSHPQRATRIAA